LYHQSTAVFTLPLITSKIQPDGQSPGRRKALPVEVARSSKTVVPTTLLVFSSPSYRPKDRDPSRVATFCPPAVTTSNSGSGGVPDLNRSGSASVLQLSRGRAQVASPSPTPGTPRSHCARQHHYTMDPRQEYRHLRTRIHSNSNNNTSTTMSARRTRDEENEERRPGTAPRGTKLPPSSAPPLLAALHARPAALRRAHRRCSATSAAIWPRQGPPPPHRSAAARHHRAPDATLRR
jgi:hypothetical protein